MSVVFVGDVGTSIVLDCGVSVANASVRQIRVKKPNGRKLTWSAVLDSTNAIKYVTTAGDLDVEGVWLLQAYIELPSWKGLGEVAQMTVSKGL